ARFEHIAHPSDSVNQLRRERLIHFTAQAAHGHVHDIRVTSEVHVPDLLGNERSGEHLPRMPCEEGEQGELLGGQIEALASASHFETEEINRQISDTDHIRLRGQTAPQEGPYAGEEFGKGEGLHQVVVRSKLQALDAVVQPITRRQKEHGCLFATAAQLREYRPAIACGKHHVEDDQIVGACLREAQSVFALGSNIHYKAV